MVVLIGERSEVGVAQSGTHGQVGTELPVILEEDSQEIFAVVVAVASRKAGGCLERAAFLPPGRRS